MLGKLKVLILVSVLIVLSSIMLRAEGKVSGVIFGDYYYVGANHREADLEGRNGFWIRRVYFTYDNLLDEKNKIRFRMEFNQNGDFVTKGKITPYIKDAFFQRMFNKRDSIIIGISAPPTYDVIEEIWGYRDIEKTALDLQKIRDSRDFGVAFKGKKDKISYHLFLGNGSGTDVELDKGKAFYAAVGYELPKNFFIQAYGDYDYKDADNSSYVMQIFLAYKGSIFRIGAHYSYSSFEAKGANYRQDIASVFAIYKINDKSDFILRYDAMLYPNPKGESISYLPFSAKADSNLVIAGISFAPHKSIKFSPNIKYIFYSDKIEDVKSDLYVNLTFTFYF
jgi:hypothetical protein